MHLGEIAFTVECRDIGNVISLYDDSLLNRMYIYNIVVICVMTYTKIAVA